MLPGSTFREFGVSFRGSFEPKTEKFGVEFWVCLRDVVWRGFGVVWECVGCFVGAKTMIKRKRDVLFVELLDSRT